MSLNFIRKMSNTVLSSCSPFKLALVQIGAEADKSKNLNHAREKIMEASKNGAQVVVLPVRNQFVWPIHKDQLIKNY